MKKANIGIDLGGSHVAIGAVNDNGEILEQHEKDFTKEEKKDILNVAITYIVETINKLKLEYEFSKFGLGMPGTISNGIILKSVNLGITNFNIKKELEEKTGMSVIVKNDSKCAAIAEYKFGDISKYKNVIFLTLGTGIGGSYIYQGNLMNGTVFEGAEFGHMTIKDGGLPCKCGKRGCFERYGAILVLKTKVIERLNLPCNLSGPELRKQMVESMDKIEDIIDEYINDLTIGLSNLVNIFEPDCIVMGGGFARYDYMLLDKLKNKLLKSNVLFNDRSDIVIQSAQLGNEAGIIGASII